MEYNMVKRTYDLEEDTINWVDSFAEDLDVAKSEVVNRALRVYAVKLDRSEWDDSYWSDDEIEEEFDKLIKENPDSVVESVEIQLNESWEDYPLIPIRKNTREFFPGYKIHFTLETNLGSLETWVSGRSTAQNETQPAKGHPTAGSYIRAKIPKWAEKHPNIEGGDFIIVEKLGDQIFRLREKR